jgi:hypothetical protein
MRALVLIVWDNDESGVMNRGIGVNGEELMAMQCPVSVSVLCSVIDPACQSYGQTYTST